LVKMLRDLALTSRRAGDRSIWRRRTTLTESSSETRFSYVCPPSAGPVFVRRVWL